MIQCDCVRAARSVCVYNRLYNLPPPPLYGQLDFLKGDQNVVPEINLQPPHSPPPPISLFLSLNPTSSTSQKIVCSRKNKIIMKGGEEDLRKKQQQQEQPQICFEKINSV